MSLVLRKDIRTDAAARESFMDLARTVFGLDFSGWQAAGYWTDLYIPYALMDGPRAVANVSVNLMDMTYRGRPRRYIQLGTVMTHPNYRGRGLARRLMERVLADWRENCDGIYLFANHTVLDFYPKFGFRRAYEYACTTPLPQGGGKSRCRRLDTANPADLKLLRTAFDRSNPYSALAMEKNWGLLLFSCGFSLKDWVYYLEEEETAVIARLAGDTLECLDLFGPGRRPLPALLAQIGGLRADLGFTPLDGTGCVFRPVETDDYLFVLEGGDMPFAAERLQFPVLSHA
ncbi:MAG: GNAT family N-acetyltransferase [Clostridiales bacterium]|nr:GNAT family N-acetyltransferase [Clostridiales bacterium]